MIEPLLNKHLFILRLYQEHWIGGFVKDGKEVHAADTIKEVFGPHFDLLESIDMPWIIRETARKHQVTFGHATVWRRNSS